MEDPIKFLIARLEAELEECEKRWRSTWKFGAVKRVLPQQEKVVKAFAEMLLGLVENGWLKHNYRVAPKLVKAARHVLCDVNGVRKHVEED